MLMLWSVGDVLAPEVTDPASLHLGLCWQPCSFCRPGRDAATPFSSPAQRLFVQDTSIWRLQAQTLMS